MEKLTNDFQFTSKVDMVKANVTESILNKGQLNDSFGGGDETIKVLKSGDEIVSALETLLIGKNYLKDELISKIKNLKDVIPTPLCCEIDNYRYKGNKEELLGMCDCLHLVYPEEATCYREDMRSNIVPFGSEASNSYTVDEQTAKMCKVYNDLVYRLIDTCSEIIIGRTMANTIPSDVKYLLNFQQLKSLGF